MLWHPFNCTWGIIEAAGSLYIHGELKKLQIADTLNILFLSYL